MAAAELPPEVATFLAQARTLRQPALRILPLSVEESLKHTQAIAAQALGSDLGLVVLDDAGDSNPYCYVSAGVARGMVVHLRHDGEPRIAFAGLPDFHAALVEAVASGRDIDDLVHAPDLLHPDQPALAAALLAACERDDDESEFLVCLLLPLLSADDAPTLSTLSASPSFFVREALACLIHDRPVPGNLALAQVLAKDPIPQVQAAGQRAIQALRRRGYAG